MEYEPRRGLRQYRGVLSVALMCVGLACAAAGAQTATLSILLAAGYVDRGQPVTGTVNIYPTGSGTVDLTVELRDSSGRIMDRYLTRVAVSGNKSVPFSLTSQHVQTMGSTVRASGQFVGGNTISPVSGVQYIVPLPIDYDDYWSVVWGSGSTSSSSYFHAINLANINLGHMTGSDSYYGYLYSVRPDHDFLEGKVWFEQVNTTPQPETCLASYKTYLLGQPASSYGTPTARQYLVRPTSINDPGSLTNLENRIRPRMQNSRKWRPLQWNIADEYGIFRRAQPYDFDLGPAAISQFVTWLQAKYGTIAALNATWNTSFSAFSDLSDPIHAPVGGQAALIVTQEMRDRELPLWSSTTTAKNFAPWSDFRTFMDESFVAAMKRCVDVGRSIDPAVRVGFEGAGVATPSTGYDYSKQLHEIGSIEAYDQGNGPEYIRSMRYDRYGNRIFSFITMFNSGSAQDNVYKLWYRLLHYGVTGTVIWVSFDSQTPSNSFFTDLSSYGLTDYATGMAPAFGEFENGLVKLLNLGDWDDSEVALLYSQKSIQILWQLDSEYDGKTWINRSNSWEPTHTSVFFDHVGWCKALEDVGIKGRFISYDDVANGVLASRGVKVLILAKTMSLSDAQKTAIENWVNAGGVLVVDNQCGYFDDNLRRRSITSGGGWWDSFLGVSRTSYATTERYGIPAASAFGGTPVFQAAPAGFAGLTSGLTASGLYAVENGIRTGTGASALMWWGGSSSQPSLIVKTYGTGKIVYMNLSMYRYGWTYDSGVPDERQTPGSASASNVRQLVKNLVALGGVTPKVAVKQGWNNPAGTDVYNLEKSVHVDGQNMYVGCVINSYGNGTNDWWGSRSDTASVCFGQPGVTDANITLSLASPAHVYDVRNGQYLGYGTSVNATMPVYEGAVFALLPYRVNSLSIGQVQFDWLNRATVTVNVVPDGGQAGNHVLRLEVFDPGGQPMPQLNAKLVAAGGIWTGVIPFAANDTVTGSKIRFTDVATGVMVEKVLTRYAGDINGSGSVDVSDLLLLAGSWSSQLGDANYSAAADCNGDHSVDAADLLLLAGDFGKS
jgi:hypothetical protein